MQTKNWFEVSKQGLKELQEGKPKHYAARELIQNAWDEDITVCEFTSNFGSGIAQLMVRDDNPEGFKNIADAFTLFAPTSKRSNAEKRGRFNLGEKQVLAIAESARIETTKGIVIFNKDGRHQKSESLAKGSVVIVTIKMSKEEYDEILKEVQTYLIPENIKFIVNGVEMDYRKSYKTIPEVSLLTEVETNGVLRRTLRKTSIDVYKTSGKARLYEMGLPVTEIECQFDVNVNQRVPLSIDRDTVPPSYLKAVFAEVLNATHGDIVEEDSSAVWIREATSDKRISSEAMKSIVEKRFGDKVVVANPFDPQANDEAIAHGYRVIRGRELSKEEWSNVQSAEAIKSSTELFGSGTTPSKTYDPDENMLKVADLAKRIAKRCLGINITVSFASWDGSVAAQFGDNHLSFNVQNLGKKFFSVPVSEQTIDIIVHEISHSAGSHTEHAYHEQITKLAGQLTMLALKEPEFFK
jgi:hypothetical protein